MPLLPFIYTFPRLCCLTPLLLSLSVATKRNAFFFHAYFAVCALKMPNRNEKKGEAVWEWTLLKWVHSCGNELVSPNIVGVCQRFCCHHCLLHITCECFLSFKKEFYVEFDWKASRKKIWIVWRQNKSLEKITWNLDWNRGLAILLQSHK